MSQIVAQPGGVIAFPRTAGRSVIPSSIRRAFRFMAKNKRLTIGFFIVGLVVLGAIFQPWLMPYNPERPNVQLRLSPPSAENWMGTDRLGRDLFSRILAGVRVSMMVAVGAVTIAVCVGVPLGAISGYAGRAVDSILMRVMDAVITFPSRLLAIALVAAAGASVGALWFAIGFHSIPRYARIIRAVVLGQKELEYVEAAQGIGESPSSILWRYIFPNCVPALMVQLTLDFAFAILVESSLSFLGLGLAPPTISLGQMLNDAQQYMESAPWTAVFPGLALSFAVLGFTLAGDGLRDQLDPRHHR